MVATFVASAASDRINPIYLNKKTGRTVQAILLISFQYTSECGEAAGGSLPADALEQETLNILHALHYYVRSFNPGEYFVGTNFSSLRDAIKDRSSGQKLISYLQDATDVDAIFCMRFDLHVGAKHRIRVRFGVASVTAHAQLFKVEKADLKSLWFNASKPIETHFPIHTSPSDTSTFQYNSDYLTQAVKEALLPAA